MPFVDVTIAAGVVATDLTNFPVMIRLSSMPAGFWSGVTDGGGDIRAQTTGGTALPIDVVSCDVVAQDGALFFKAPSILAASSNTFRLTWDGSSAALPATDANGRNAVWSDYHRVFFWTPFDGLADHTGNGAAPTPAANFSTFVGTVISPETSSHEGVAWDGTYYYTTDVNAIRKWTAAWSLVTTNSNPCASIGVGVNHLGDPEVVGSVLYVPAENYSNPTTWSTMRIARFNTSDLSFIDSVDISAQNHEAAALAYCPDDGYLYLASYANPSKLLRFAVSTLAYVSTLTLSGGPAAFINGLTYWRGRFWIAGCSTEFNSGLKRLWSITPAGVITTQPVLTYSSTGFQEGLSHTASALLHLFSTGAGQGTVSTLTPRFVAGGGGAEFRNPAMGSVTNESSHALAAGVTRYTQWTLGVSALMTDKSSNSENFVNYAVSGDVGNTNRAALGWRVTTDRLGLWNNADAWLEDTVAPAVATTYRLHDVHDGTTSRKLYKNGSLAATDTTITAMPGATANALYFGISGGDLVQPLHGSLGFIYLRASILSAAWIAAESLNVLTPGSFYSVGAVSSTIPRVTQLVAETLTPGPATASAGAVTQVVAETLTGGALTASAAAVTQLAAETLTLQRDARVAQVVVETLTLTASIPPVPPLPTGTLARYVSFATPASAGLQTVSGVGFRGVALILWGTRQAKRRAEDAAILCVGMTDGVQQVCRSIIHPDNETATTSAQSEWFARIVFETMANTAVVNHGEFVAFTDDGFTIDWIATDGGRDIRHAIVIGGSDLIQANYVAVKIDQPVGTPIPVTGVGFTPDCFIVIGGALDEFSEGSVGYSNGAPFGSICGFGFSNGAGTNICGWTLGRGTGGAADNYRGQHTDRVASVRVANLPGAADLCGSTITQILPDGFVMERVAGSHTPYQHVLAIRGVTFAMGSMTTPTVPSTTTLPITFAPHLVMMQSHGLSVPEGGGLGLAFGFHDRLNSGGIWIGGVNASSPSIYARANYRSRVLQLRTPLADGLASPVILDAAIADISTPEVDWTVVPATPVLVNWLALAPAGWLIPTFENATITIGLTYMRLRTRSGAFYYWSDRPLPDPDGYEGGWKAPRVLEWGRIRRALSGFDGQYETSDFVVTLDDTDRVLRELDKDRELVNATVIVKMIPDDDRRLELPWSTVYRGVIRDARPLGTLRYEMTIKDPFAEQFAADANPVPLRTIQQPDFANCATTNVGSSATGYTAGGAAAGAETMTVSGGTGTFVDGDVITFAGHATLYTISDQTTDDPETAIIFSPALTDPVAAGEVIAVRAKYEVTPANGRRVPFWYGHITDRVVIDGIDQGDGQGPVIYVGDRQLPDGHTYGEFLWAGHACYSATPIPMLYFWNESLDDLSVGIPGVNDLATEAGTGGRIALPGFANWSDNGFTTPYVDYNGRRYTVLFLRGFYRDWALGIRPAPPNLGGVPFAVEAYGCETVGDGSGTLILDGLAQYRHILQNWCPPRGGGYQSGAWLSTLMFVDDPTVPMLDEPSFDTAQAQSAVYTAALGESAGVRGDFGVGVNDEAIRVRDLLARLNVSFGVEAGFSKHAQYFVTMPNRDISTITLAAPLGWERDIFKKTFAIDAKTRDLFTSLGLRHTQDFFNRVSGDWRSIAVDEPSTFTDQVVTNPEAVTAYGADTVYHDVLLYMVRGKNRIGDPPEYARGSTTAEVVMTLKLARTSWVQHIAKLQTGPAGFNYELGDILAITHYEGLSETGWTAYPVRVERIEIDPSTYTTVLETFAYESMLVGGPFNPDVFNPDVFNT
jgi:hypothetical protein